MKALAVILAGGQSRRMGVPKALLAAGPGLSFLTLLVETFHAAGIPSLVVLGAHAPEIRAAHAEVPFVINPHWPEGQLSSVRVGLRAALFQGAQGVLVNITGGKNMTLLEVSEATQIIHDAAGDDANIIFGAVLDESMTDEIMVTVIATGFNNKPTFTGLSYPGEEKSNIPYVSAEEVLGAKRPPRVERMTAPMTMDEYEERKRIMQNDSSASVSLASPREPEVSLPKVERISHRGTLPEREQNGNAFERLSNGAFRASTPVRLTPSNETNHVPSGPRDLKEFDTPAYLRRGITLPSIEEQEEAADAPVMAGEREETPQQQTRARDDRPTFLRKIMD